MHSSCSSPSSSCSSSPTPDPMKVFIVKEDTWLLDWTIEVSPYATIMDLKKRIEELHQIPVSTQTLKYNGNLLHHDDLVAHSCNVVDDYYLAELYLSHQDFLSNTLVNIQEQLNNYVAEIAKKRGSGPISQPRASKRFATQTSNTKRIQTATSTQRAPFQFDQALGFGNSPSTTNVSAAPATRVIPFTKISEVLRNSQALQFGTNWQAPSSSAPRSSTQRYPGSSVGFSTNSTAASSSSAVVGGSTLKRSTAASSSTSGTEITKRPRFFVEERKSQASNLLPSAANHQTYTQRGPFQFDQARGSSPISQPWASNRFAAQTGIGTATSTQRVPFQFDQTLGFGNSNPAMADASGSSAYTNSVSTAPGMINRNQRMFLSERLRNSQDFNLPVLFQFGSSASTPTVIASGSAPTLRKSQALNLLPGAAYPQTSAPFQFGFSATVPERIAYGSAPRLRSIASSSGTTRFSPFGTNWQAPNSYVPQPNFIASSSGTTRFSPGSSAYTNSGSTASGMKLGYLKMKKLPFDLETLILARVPVKGLIRFRCVCKKWRSLFQEEWFIRQHMSYAPSKIMSYDTSRTIYAYSLSYENGYTIAQEVDLSSGDQSLVQERGVVIIGHCNGLFCLHFENRSLAIWNPALRELRKIQGMTTKHLNKETVYMGFGYDYSIEDYKILLVVPLYGGYEAQVLTVKSNRSKMIDFPSRSKEKWTGRKGTLAGENIFWQLYDVNMAPEEEILSFSLVSETFSYCSGPKLGKEKYRDLIVSRGNLYVVTMTWPIRSYTSSNDYVLWCAQHDDKGVIKSWSMNLRFTIGNLFRKSIGSYYIPGNVILITDVDMFLRVWTDKLERKLGAYNFGEKSVKVFVTEHLGYGSVFEYIETLVSPRSIMERRIITDL